MYYLDNLECHDMLADVTTTPRASLFSGALIKKIAKADSKTFADGSTSYGYLNVRFSSLFCLLVHVYMLVYNISNFIGAIHSFIVVFLHHSLLQVLSIPYRCMFSFVCLFILISQIHVLISCFFFLLFFLSVLFCTR